MLLLVYCRPKVFDPALNRLSSLHRHKAPAGLRLCYNRSNPPARSIRVMNAAPVLSDQVRAPAASGGPVGRFAYGNNRPNHVAPTS